MSNKTLPPTANTVRAMDNFALWLRRKLSVNRVSQAKFAKAIGLERKTINSYVNKKAEPKLSTIFEIYNYFDESSIYLPFKE